MATPTQEDLQRYEALRSAASARRVHPRKSVVLEAKDLAWLVELAGHELERRQSEPSAVSDAKPAAGPFPYQQLGESDD